MALENKGVLIIEDDLSIRETLAMAIELEGYSVHTAAEGQAGLDALTRIPRPGLILLDLMMPVMNGWQFVERMRQIPAHSNIPIVVITAFANQTEGLDINGVLKKPLDLNVLYQTIQRWCGPTDDHDKRP